MKKFLVLPLLIMFSTGMHAQLPTFYDEVDHVLWVVNNLDDVTASWKDLGFQDIEILGKAEIESPTDQSTARIALGYLNGVKVLWIEPQRGGNPFRSFLRARGEGVMALIHSPAKKEFLSAELERLSGLNIAKTEDLTLTIQGKKITYHFMDTGELGKYYIGLVTQEESSDIINPNKAGENSNGLTFSQYAFAIRNPEPVSNFWVSYGMPPMKVDHAVVRQKKYYGDPGNFKMDLGWQRHGKIAYEWCIPVSGENVYSDHIEVSGEGVHHFGFQVPDMNEAVKTLTQAGFIVSQSGAWGEEGKPGSGRFSYLDPQHLGGIAIELLWSYK